MTVLRVVVADDQALVRVGFCGFSPASAKTHVAHLLTKLDARDRIQLVIIAYQSGLVSTG
jgi:hypothetical protein